MSRHLNAVATSTLHKKQAQHQLARRKLSRQNQAVATTFVLRSCRDKIRLSRQHLYWEDVTTRSRCRDNNYTERTSRQKSGCRDNNCTSNLSQKTHKPATKPSTKPVTRTATRLVTTTALQTCRSNTQAYDKTCDKNCEKACDNIYILGQFAKVQQEMPQN